MFDNQKTVFCFLFLEIENMVFLENIFISIFNYLNLFSKDYFKK